MALNPTHHPVFSGINFPEYEFREYPKWIATNPKNPMEGQVVNDEDEEAVAVGGAIVVRDVDERARLIAVATVRGVQIDKRWSVAKLTNAILVAGFDPEFDPTA